MLKTKKETEPWLIRQIRENCFREKRCISDEESEMLKTYGWKIQGYNDKLIEDINKTIDERFDKLKIILESKINAIISSNQLTTAALMALESLLSNLKQL